MPAAEWWLSMTARALLLAGAAGAVALGGGHHARRPVSLLSTLPAPPTSLSTPPSSGSATPGRSSVQLSAGLITPTDMGGFYRPDPAYGSGFVTSAPCLAGLASSPAQSGRAVTALLGPDANSVPSIVEVVASYGGATATGVYRAVANSIAACPNFSMLFGGRPVQVPISGMAIAPVGNAVQAWQGGFSADGEQFTLQLGIVLAGPDVVGLVFVQSVPPAPAVMGDFTSTLSLALGKLA